MSIGKLIFYALAVTAMALIFAGCASEPIYLQAPTAQQGMVSFATLSSSDDPVEDQASVVYTHLARYRYNAASLLRQQKISVGTAKYALRVSDDIRADLDAAVAGRNLLNIHACAKRIDRAANELERDR